MSINKYLTSLLLGSVMAVNPAAVEAGGMSHIPSVGQAQGAAGSNRNCKPGVQGQTAGGHAGISGHLNVQTKVDVNKPTSVNRNIDVNKPTTVNKNIDVNKPSYVNKNVDVNKPVSVNKNIDINKPVSITKNIDNSKNININNNIDNSKNININKTIIINKGGGGSHSQADAQAEAAAIASAVAAAASNSSSSAAINFNGSVNSSANSSANSSSFSSAFGYSGAGTVSGASSIAETPGAFAGGDFGNINVEIAAPVAPRAQCTFEDSTVIKAIHAVCVSADNHEFPASHMVADTWINASYEGEVARCIPGSHLKVIIGKVLQSSEGAATGYTSGQVLECGLHEAVRHYKDGQLKCAPAVPVPDCTERTNLRKYGIGDMFFTYRAKVCLETHDEYPQMSSVADDRRY